MAYCTVSIVQEPMKWVRRKITQYVKRNDAYKFAVWKI